MKITKIYQYATFSVLALVSQLNATQVYAGMDEMAGMSAMTTPSSGTMNNTTDGGMKKMGCMECMGMMGQMGGMTSSDTMSSMSSLPGFPGASHLYHVGADGFFVNHHPLHITLDVAQQTQLNTLKQKAFLDKATAERTIEAAEQDLFVLTGVDQPDARKIETQLRTIEGLRVQQRMNYIRAVGEAAKVLTAEQRSVLLGNSSSGGNAPSGH